jgi:transposase
LISVSQQSSYEDLAALVAVQARVIDELRLKVAELERQLGRDSTNSGQPSSKDSIAAKAKKRADASIQLVCAE